MTSKECLLDLVRRVNLIDCENKVLYYQQIAKDLDLLDSAILYIARTTMKDKTYNEIREALERGIVKDDK